MFGAIRSEILDRIFSVRLLASATKSITARRARPATKGLVFVQLYAAYEYTIVSTVRAAMTTISGHNIELRKLRDGLQVLALDSELASIADTARRASWDKRLGLFKRARSADIARLSDAVFPDDGNHFKYPQLE